MLSASITTTTATASDTATTSTASNGMWVYYVMIAVLFIAMYFISIRPQNKKEKELKNLRDQLEVGDEIMTIGGFYGTVVRIKDDKVTIASGAEKTKLEVSKQAISNVLNREIPKANDAKASKAEEKPEKANAKNIKKLSKKESDEDAKEE